MVFLFSENPQESSGSRKNPFFGVRKRVRMGERSLRARLEILVFLDSFFELVSMCFYRGISVP